MLTCDLCRTSTKPGCPAANEPVKMHRLAVTVDTCDVRHDRPNGFAPLRVDLCEKCVETFQRELTALVGHLCESYYLRARQ